MNRGPQRAFMDSLRMVGSTEAEVPVKPRQAGARAPSVPFKHHSRNRTNRIWYMRRKPVSCGNWFVHSWHREIPNSVHTGTVFVRLHCFISMVKTLLFC